MGLEEGGGQGSPPNLEALIQKVLSDREGQKEQTKKIDGLQQDMRLVKGLICDKDGNCRLPTREDLTQLVKKQGAKADLSQYSGQELWNQLKKNPNHERDVANIHLEMLKKDEDYLKKALEDREVVGKMVTLLCDDEGCRLVFNEEVDKAHKNGKTKGQKESWLTKK